MWAIWQIPPLWPGKVVYILDADFHIQNKLEVGIQDSQNVSKDRRDGIPWKYRRPYLKALTLSTCVFHIDVESENAC